MNNKVAQAAMIVAAVAAMNERHYDHNGFATNRKDYRRRYGKRKGGGRGIGMIEGLPHKAAPIRQGDSENRHMQNRASWRRPRVLKSERVK